MKIAIYGRNFNSGFIPYIQQVYDILTSKNAEIYIYKPFMEFIHKNTGMEINIKSTFSGVWEFPDDMFLIISIGGDGTFLETLPFALKCDIPVVGINSGRLGFLANISQDDIIDAFDALFQNNYHIEYRSLLRFVSPDNLFGDFDFALNDITIQKRGSSLITIETYLNNEFLNTYWTDGLIISTPTGSTAYSLSGGGPVVIPGSGTLILTPIASHNLTVRPIVIPDTLNIRLKAYSRINKFLVTADNRTIEIEKPMEFILSKAEVRLKMLQLPNNSFYSTIRNKLMWGADKRN